MHAFVPVAGLTSYRDMSISVLLSVRVFAVPVSVAGVALAAGCGNGDAPPPLPADVLQACMLERVKGNI